MTEKLRLLARIFVVVSTFLILWAAYAISFALPRSREFWVFGSHKNLFNENSKYLFLETALHDPIITAIWLSGSGKTVRKVRALGFKAYMRWSPKGIWYALRAGVHVYSAYISDTNFWFSGRAIRVNLWHGVPLKVIERDIKTGPLASRYQGSVFRRLPYILLQPFYYSVPDYVLAPSAHLGRILPRALGCQPACALHARYPRIDAISHDFTQRDPYFQHLRNEAREAVASYFHKEDRKRILYAPTWREWDRTFIQRVPIDWPRLEEALIKINATLIVKLHQNSRVPPELFGEQHRIRLAPALSDIYPLLGSFDFLITDYSSIYFDFLFLDREIIFFPYDRNVYLEEGRSLYGDYDELTPGIKIYTGEDLIRVLCDLDKLDYAHERSRIKETMWGTCSNNARVVIKQRLGVGEPC